MIDLHSPDLAFRMAELARVTSAHSVDDVLVDVTATARELIPGAEVAGVLLMNGRKSHSTLAPTNDVMFKLDDLQMSCGEGPCLQAARAEVVVRIDDFRDEPRFPRYAPQVVELGLLSALSFKLYSGGQTAGSLNLFGYEPNQWNSAAETVGTVLAAHATAAILASRNVEQLQSALVSRDRIGQAKGILMERFGITAVEAFTLLRQLSQETNLKLVDVAARLVDTRGD